MNKKLLNNLFSFKQMMPLVFTLFLISGMFSQTVNAQSAFDIIATATCAGDDGGTVVAGEGQYYVRVTDVTSLAASPFDLTIDGQTLAWEDGVTTSLYFGPFAHSGAGGAVQVVNAVSQADPASTGTFEVVEALCGFTTTQGVIVDAGMDGIDPGDVSTPGLNASGSYCDGPTTDPLNNTGTIIVQSMPGSFQTGGTSGQEQQYVLVRNGFIVQANMSGLFVDLPSDTFVVYAVNYRDTEPVPDFLNPGQAFAPILNGINTTTGDSPLDGACYTVCNSEPVIMVPVNCMSVGSTIFADLDNNGLFDGVDVGIEGVTVELVVMGSLGQDSVIASTVTGPNGDYYFGGLEAGMYAIQVPTPPTAFPASSMDIASTTLVEGTGIDNDDNGLQVGGPGTITQTPYFNLTPQMEGVAGEIGQGGDQDANETYLNLDGDMIGMSDDDANGDMNIDLGFTPSMSLGSTVFYDTNNDGMQDAANPLESGIEGLTVNLYADLDGNGVIDPDPAGPDFVTSTTTNAMGDYLFENLNPGDYIVGVEPSADAQTASGNTVTDPDDNLDGVNDGSQVAEGDQSVSMTITLVPMMEPVNGTGPMDESGQGNMQDDAMDSNGNMTVDFGFVPDLSIGSTVFYDFDDNGMQDAGGPEVGIPGVTVQLFADLDNDPTTAETLVATTVTNAMGNYFFDMLPMGNYQVVIATPSTDAPLSSTTTATVVGMDGDVDADDNGDQPGGTGTATSSNVFPLTPNNQPLDATETGDGGMQDNATATDDADGNMTIDFGFVPSFSLGSTVFADLNNNATQDAGELGVEGVVVTLYEDDGVTVVTMTTTDANGDYFFDGLLPGDYIVGITPTTDLPLSSDEALDEDDPNLDVDGNDNGTQAGGAGTPILSGIVSLGTDGMAEPTNADTELGQGNLQDDASVTSDAAGNMTVDFGLFPGVSLGSTVFIDENNDGQQMGAGETGIEGVTVLLYAAGDLTTPIGQTVTDADGNYLFDMLAEGDYVVAVVPNTDYPVSSGGASAAANEESDPNLDVDGNDNGVFNSMGAMMLMSGDTVFSGTVTLSAGDEPTATGANTTATETETGEGADQDGADDSATDANGNMSVDFGFHPGVSIGSTVFFDLDNDGMFEESDGETGIVGVLVYLLDDGGTVIDSTTTDDNGNYYFAGLDPGMYEIQIPTSAFAVGQPLESSPLSSTPTDGEGDDGVDGNDNGMQAGGAGTVVSSGLIDLQLNDENTFADGENGEGSAQDDANDNDGDMSVDFGFFPTVSIGSTVFSDDNNSGDQDGLEMGVAGVTVILYEDTNNDGMYTPGVDVGVDTVMTDAMGNYEFDTLAPGNYIVAVVPPVDMNLSSNGPNENLADDGSDGNDNGMQDMAGDTIFTNVIMLMVGTEPTNEPFQGGTQDDDDDQDDDGDMTVDIGLVTSVSVGSTVFADTNNDGTQGATEAGVPGVIVTLLDGAGNVVATDTTDANGDYFFDGLYPGDYQLAINMVPDSLPTSSTDIATSGDGMTDQDDDGTQLGGTGTSITTAIFTLEPNAYGGLTEVGTGGAQDDAANDDDGNMTYDFGLVPSYSLGSTVFADLNNNATQDAGELGVEGVVVTLYEDDGVTVVTMTTTDANGDYFFDGLLPGDYIVGITPTTDLPLSSDEALDEDDPNLDVDGNDNGTQAGGAGTPILSGIVSLGTDGMAEPTNADTELGQGNLQDDASVTSDAAGNMTVDFGLFPGVSLGSTVFIDENNDGQQMGAGETGIEGVTVLLYAAGDLTTPIGQTVTDADGNYLFDMLAEGDYVVAVVPNTDYPVSSGGASAAANEESDPNLDVDGNDNGVFNSMGAMMLMSGDTVFSGTVTLSAGDEPTATGANTTATETETGEGADQDGADDSATDANGNMSVDFGFHPGVSIGSTVFFDLDNDGMFEESDGETGIVGVLVYLLDDGGTVIDSTTTDDNGNYYFAGLDPGMYEIQIPTSAFAVGQPLESSPLSSTPTDGEGDDGVDGNDNGMQAGGAGTVVSSGLIDLQLNDENTFADGENGEGSAQDDANDNDGDMSVDFGFFPTVSIGSTVFSDDNNSGDQDGLEMGVAGVTVILYEDTNNDGMYTPGVDVGVDTVMTDAMGNYEFDTLAPGNYIVAVVPPVDMNLSSNGPNENLADDGSDGNDNGMQDMAGDTIFTNVIMLMVGTEPTNEPFQGGTQDDDDDQDDDGDMTVDIGLVTSVSVGSTVFADTNNDGTQGATEAGVPGVIVTLLDGAGNVVATDTTDANGDYFFDGLYPGDYQLAINMVPDSLPTSSTDIATSGDGMTDQDDDGTQLGGTGTSITTAIFTLEPNAYGGLTEVGTGGAQDDAANDDDGNMTYDFGLVPSYSLGSTVFADLNNNATQDAGELGVEGIVVTLYESDGVTVVTTTTTDANGDYFFGGLLPGDYIVGITPTTDLPLSSDETLDEDDPNADVDGNDNGTQAGGAGTPILSGIVSLGNDGLAEPTNADTELGQGNLQDDASMTSDAAGNMTVDFGLFPGVSLGSTVFADDDNNGTQDVGETGIEGVTVVLLDATMMPLDTVVTGPNGEYFFGGLQPGTYFVSIPVDDNFGAGNPLENTGLSSETTDEMDNQEDGDDNGIQAGGEGTSVISPAVVLTIGGEPTNAGGENGTNNLQDDAYDANGDMTVDFGFVPVMFDLALTKELADGQSMVVNPGDTVTFTITVYNQGNIAADNITVTDSIPAGLTFYSTATDNVIWTGGAAPKVSATITDFNGLASLAPDSTVMVDIKLIVDVPQDAAVSLTNVAEISNATNQFGMDVEDVDSTPDDNLGNDNFLQDNEISGNGLAGEDEDDHDPATVITNVFDLAIRKSLNADQDVNVMPGDTVTYDIIVYNQGGFPAGSVTLQDSFPAQLTLISEVGVDSFTMTAAGLATATLNFENGLAVGATDTVQVRFVVTNVPPAGNGAAIRNFASITMATDTLGNEQQDDDSDYTDNDDIDDTDNDDIDGDGMNGGDEDESDFEDVILGNFDLAIRKTLSAGQSSVVSPGEMVSYDVVVFNQGTVTANEITVQDSFPADLLTLVAGGDFTETSAGIATATISLADALAPGDSTLVSISFTVASPLPANLSIRNFASITSAQDSLGNDAVDVDSDYTDNDVIDDNDNDDVSGNGIAGEDEDESDFEDITTATFDLALAKTLSDGQNSVVAPGDTVSYDIIVFNQGDIPADEIVLQDSFPVDLLTLVTAGTTADDVFVAGATAGTADYTLSIGGSGLAPGASDTVTVRFVLASPLPAGLSIRNFASIEMAQDTLGNEQQDDDSTYGDEDDIADSDDDSIDEDGTNGGDEDESDFEDITTAVFDLAIRKSLSADQDVNVMPGDTVTYDIVVYNQGEFPAGSVTVQDSFPAQLTLIEEVGVDSFMMTAAGLATATLNFENGLAVGATDTVQVRFVVTNVPPAGNGAAIRNYASITMATDTLGNEQQDNDSDYTDNDDIDDTDNDDIDGDGTLGGDEDESDFEDVILGNFDLAIRKTLSAGQSSVVSPGEMVSYDVVVFNQGTVTANEITVQDSFPADLLTLVAGGDFTETSAGIATATISLADALAPGDSTLVSISFTVASPLPANLSIRNFASITSAQDSLGNDAVDVDSDYTDNDVIDDNDNDDVSGNGIAGEDEDESDFEDITTATFDLALAKTLSDGQNSVVAPGDTVSYDIIVFNQGDIPADEIVLQDSFPVDLLTLVTAGTTADDVFVAGATAGTADYTLSIGGSGLAPGASDTVTVRFVLASPLPAGLSIRNFASIEMAQDTLGNEQQDDDSTYGDEDDIADSDDDSIDEDGTNGGDEDESDFEDITTAVFDLAIRKSLSADQDVNVMPGDTVTYDIVVYNQGEFPAGSVTVQDSFPAQLTLIEEVGVDSFMMTAAGLATATLNFENGLAVGATDTVQVRFVVTNVPPAGNGAAIRNYASITMATDTLGNEQQDNDSDYTDNDDIDDTDNDDIDGDGTLGGDEDESDFEDVILGNFDLAIRKTLSAGQSSVVSPGEMVSYDVVVFNQGTVTANEITVQDSFPADLLTLVAGGDFTETSAGIATATISLADALAPGDSTLVSISFTVASPLPANLSIRNFASITSAQDSLGNDAVDVDSDYTDNDVIDDNDNDDVSGNGIAGEDEDESDFEDITTATFDLALAKTLSDGQNSVVAPGDTVSYDIIVFNQGDIPADEIVLQDSFPVDLLTLVTAGTTADDVFVAGATAGTADYTLSIGGSGLAPGASDTVTVRFVLASPLPAGLSIRNFASIEMAQDTLGNEQQDDDSTYGDEDDIADSDDDSIDEDGTNGGDEDESDFEDITTAVFDLAIRKSLSADQDVNVMPGDTVTYDIVVYNQGEFPAGSVTVQDSFPAQLTLIEEVGVDSFMMTAAGLATATLNFENGLAVGATDTVQVRFVVTNVPPAGNGAAIRNYASITMATDTLGNEQQDNDSDYTDNDDIDDTDNDDIDGDGTLGGDEDESDFEDVILGNFDLAIRKELSAGQSSVVSPGEMVSYDVVVFNQGTITANEIVVQDSFPADQLTLVTGGDFTETSAGIATATISLADALAPGDSTVVSISFTVASPLPANLSIRNFASITSAQDSLGNDAMDVDSDYTDNDVIDDNDNDDVSGNGMAGEDEDESDFEDITTATFDLALAKTLSEGQNSVVAPGDTISYDIIVFNQGDIPADEIVLQDSFPVDLLTLVTAGTTADDVFVAGATAGTADYTLSIGGSGLAPGASDTVTVRFVLANPLPAGLSVRNFASIEMAQDTLGNEQQDDDSTYGNEDDIADSDDDSIDEDGTNGGDEDESDFEDITTAVFDLAIRKSLNADQDVNVMPGDTVTYDIVVYNQGEFPAGSVTVQDSFPAQLTLISEVGVDSFTMTAAGLATATLNFDNGLAVGATDTVQVRFVVTNVPPAGNGAAIRNYASITMGTDTLGNEQQDNDSDYTDNDDIDDTDNDDIDGDGTLGGDEDESDFEDVILGNFDLAIRKELSAGQSSVVSPGEMVSYDVVVFNQGTITANEIVVQDSFPADQLTLVTGGDFTETSAGIATATISLADALAPGDSTVVSISFTVASPLPANLSIRNFASITSAQDSLGNDAMDVDSDYTDNDVIDDNDNDDVSGNGMAGEDEDESDFEDITTATFDLALAKTLSEGQNSVVAPGDTISYDIIVFNQGDIPADEIVLQDSFPVDLLTLVTAGTTADDVFVAGATAGTADYTLSIGGSGLAPGASDTVTVRFVLANPLPAGLSVRNFASIEMAQDTLGNEQQDDDSTYGNEDDIADSDDDSIDEDGTNGGDEDESDFEDITTAVFDLALQKKLSAGQMSMVDPGDTISYDLIITNQGDIAADNIAITDYIPEGMTLDASFGNFVFDAATMTATDTFTVADGEIAAGGLLPGESATFQIRLILDDPLDGGLTFRNIAEIESATDDNGNSQDDNDSDYSDPNNPDDIDDQDDDDIDGDGQNGGDEDESDFEDIITRTFDLALIKTLADGQSANVEAGDTVAFNIRVINQGGIAADSIRVSDYIPAQVDGFLFDPTLNPGWSVYASIDNTLYVDTILTDFNGQASLAPGSFIDIPIFLVVNPAMEAVMPLTNVAEISGATGENGEEVVDVDSPMDTIPGNDNFFEDNNVNGDGLNGGDEDNSDPATIFVGGFDLALEKVLTVGESNVVSPGDEVTFDITVFNQGAIPADNIEVIDYVPAGFIFNPALNPDWAADGDNAVTTISVANGGLPAGGLLPTQNTTVQITLTVAPPMFPDYAVGVVAPDSVNVDGVESGQVLTNTAEITAATDDEGEMHTDIDSNPDDMNNDNDDGNEDDGEINGGGDTDGDGINDEDEDDSDIAVVTVECYQDPGVTAIEQVCLGCDEAVVTINLLDALSGRPNVGGTFLLGDFFDDEGNTVILFDTAGVEFGEPGFDVENVVIPGTLDRSEDFAITYTIPAVNDCPERSSTLIIDIIDIQNLTCDGFTNISLGEDCEAIITPDMILGGDFTCANSLTVELQDANGVSIGNVVNGDYLNQVLTVNLIDPQCNNSCWGEILVEDKVRPTIECPDTATAANGADFICMDIDQILNNTASMAQTGMPLIDDNCTPTEDLVLVFFDRVLPTDNPMCDTITIERVFTVTDESGNSAMCTQVIRVRPANLDDVTIPSPDDLFEVSCGDAFDALPNGNPTVEAVGGASITTAYGTTMIGGNSNFCNIAAAFEDGPRVVTCENTFKFIRTWTIFDWCQTDTSITFTQLIKVGDFDAPTMTAPTQDLNFDGVADQGPLFFTTNSTDCTAFFQIPSVNATDDCSSEVDVVAFVYPNGNLDGAPIGGFAEGELAGGFPEGTHTLSYIATDACGNSDTLSVEFTVGDLTAPVAICEDGLNISLGGNGLTVVPAADFDAGSHDDCGAVTIEVACVNGDGELLTDYGPNVQFDCEDLGIKRVSLRVTDESGNVNYCWLDVLIEDKIAPICIAPAPMTVLCTDLEGDFPQDLEAAFAADEVGTAALLDDLFGAATGVDNCSISSVEQVVVDNRTSCGSGVIRRSFVVTDGLSDNSPLTSTGLCTQLISVIGVHDYTIVFPADAENDNCVEPDYNAVTFTENGCDLITVSTSMDTFSATADECYKIRVTYEVLNWCEYNTENDLYIIPRDADNDGNLNEATFLHVTAGATTTSLADDVAFLDRDNDRTNATTIANLDTGDGGMVNGMDAAGYGLDGSRGGFIYQQYIKVYDNTAPVVNILEADGGLALDDTCLGDIDLNFMVMEECSPESVAVTADLDAFITAGDYNLADFNADENVSAAVTIDAAGNATVDLNGLPIGRHAVRVVVSDGCGNTTPTIIIFTIEDGKAPTPICINGLTATLMPDGNGGGMGAIWANDFIASPATDCTGPVKYAIYRSDDAAADENFAPSLADTGLVLTCDDLGMLAVRIYAIDGNGNADYCETTLFVQAFNEDVCTDTGGTIAGLITTEAMVPVEGVEVSLAGTDGMSTAMVTSANGLFSFSSLPGGEDYTISPSHFSDYMNGVTTSDIVAITRHILGLNSFTSPYQYIAGDVNGTESINVVDIIAIRRLILGLADNFPNGNPSWRFVSADYSFPQATNPWAEVFPEVNNHNNLVGNIVNSDFVAAKLGDIDGTAIPNTLYQPEPRNLRGDLMLEMEGMNLQNGETYEVPVRSADLGTVNGYQFTLEFDRYAVDLVRIEAGLVQDGNFGLRFVDQGLVTTSWNWENGVAPTNWSADEVLFTLILKSKADVALDEVLNVTSRFTEAEAYGTDGNLHNVSLAFEMPELVQGGYVLHQNSPNPFVRETMLGYELPIDAKVTITVTDVTGRLIRSYNQDGVAGYNSLRVTRRQLGGQSGVYYYTVSTDDWTASKKMILLE